MDDVRGWKRRIPFKVHIAGIIEIMGASLYSRATTPIRELLQNAHDGIMRRRQRDLAFQGRIDVIQDAQAHTLSFIDDGIGLDEQDAERYLGTLGIGITGLLKKGTGDAPSAARTSDAGAGLIGQFGIGLFSGFMLADRIVVETRKADGSPAVRWEAGADVDIELSSSEREEVGTTVTLYLKPKFHSLAEQTGLLEEAIKEYADFLPLPIYLNRSAARVNLINAAWFDATPERETIELELESFFHETALDVIPIHIESPVHARGALYVTPQRTPGFSGDTVVTVTVRRMVISRRIQGLLPPWASIFRGVLELNDCSPTASREDLVRDESFERAKAAIESILFSHLEELLQKDLARLQSIISWHRYTLAGSAITNPRLRDLLTRAYPFGTSQGLMSFEQIVQRSEANPVFEAEASHVLWCNGDRRQEQWANSLFSGNEAPCIHTVRSFEETLLAMMAADKASKEQMPIAVRSASPSSPGFSQSILGIADVEEADAIWMEFFKSLGVRVMVASFDPKQPVMVFLNERHELMQTFEQLKKTQEIPAGFQRLIDQHFKGEQAAGNEVLLNRSNSIVSRALSQKTSHPIASVLRMLVIHGLAAAGATVSAEARRSHLEDLDWVADALWVRHT